MADDSDEEVFAGVTRPMMGGGGGAAPPSEDDDDDDEAAPPAAPAAAAASSSSGLLSADAAFEMNSSSYELDPFRVAGPVVTADEPAAPAGRKGAGARAKPSKKLFVAGLPYDLDEAGLLKAFVKFGKVQEAAVVRGEGGKPRGFGFVTFVHQKGATYCAQPSGARRRKQAAWFCLMGHGSAKSTHTRTSGLLHAIG